MNKVKLLVTEMPCNSDECPFAISYGNSVHPYVCKLKIDDFHILDHPTISLNQYFNCGLDNKNKEAKCDMLQVIS